MADASTLVVSTAHKDSGKYFVNNLLTNTLFKHPSLNIHNTYNTK